MKKFFKSHKLHFKTLSVFALMVVLVVTVFYPLMPSILNYPKGTYNNDFQWELEKANYTMQFVEISLAIIIIYCILLFWKLSFFKNYNSALKNNDTEELLKIRSKLFTVPNELYLLQIIIPSIGVPLLYAITTKLIGITTIKVFILYASFITVIATFSFIYIRKQFANILTKINIPLSEFEKKSTLRSRINIQIIPLIIVSLLITSLVGYSSLINSNSEKAYVLYKIKLEEIFKNTTYTSVENLYNDAYNIKKVNDNDIVFILEPNDKYYDVNHNEIKFSDFWNKYLKEFSLKDNSMVYDYYGVDVRGAILKVPVNNQTYIVGVQYDLTSYPALYTLGISSLSLLILNLLTLLVFSSSLSKEVSTVSKNMQHIAKSKSIQSFSTLPITSNDEIGELVIAFNEIQNLTKDNITTIKNSQDSLIEQERLASLGQMIGGIAHNLKTPIMSVSGAAEGLTELIAEYTASIDNPIVSAEDHKEIAKDMLDWVTKIKTHISYMSDIITTVKDQAAYLNASASDTFSVYDLSKKVTILMKHEIKKALLSLNVNIKCDPSTLIHGDVNNLIQVVNNLITNAIHSYNGKINQTIDFIIDEDDDNIIIKIKDYGCGIPKEIQNKLFKEMITTKGKNGTGLGLYMSYSTIKGKFNGTLNFISEENKGTTFIISIPKTNKED